MSLQLCPPRHVVQRLIECCVALSLTLASPCDSTVPRPVYQQMPWTPRQACVECCNCFFQSMPGVQVLPQLITTKKQLSRAITLSKQANRVAIDCEGCQLSHEGRLCLVQVGLRSSAIMTYRGCMLLTPRMLHVASAHTALTYQKAQGDQPVVC